MYFVTTKQPDYIMFSMTPSECAAVGLTEKQEVHFLLRDSIGAAWRVAAQWAVADCSHTDFMMSLQHVVEPADPARLLEKLPPTAKLPA